jgi:hypothetical protein
MKNIFTKHPNSINETYFQHLKFAGLFGLQMLTGAITCILHAIFPFVFEKTGSNILLKMTREFVERMPKPDERVLAISDIIDAKKNK